MSQSGPGPSRPESTGPDFGEHERAGQHWFAGLAEIMGPAYLRYAHTKGTVAEVDALVELLRLKPGDRVLDVGCGPGRHAHELARRGLDVVGVDLAPAFVDLAGSGAPPGASFVLGDARDLFAAGTLGAEGRSSFDAAFALCQGAFGTADPVAEGLDPWGLTGDLSILASMAAAVRPGGRVAVSGFSVLYQLAFQVSNEADQGDEPDCGFDPVRSVVWERTEVRDPGGRPHQVEMWNTGFTRRELALMARIAGLEVDLIRGVEPGRLDGSVRSGAPLPELLLVGYRPAPTGAPATGPTGVPATGPTGVPATGPIGVPARGVVGMRASLDD